MGGWPGRRFLGPVIRHASPKREAHSLNATRSLTLTQHHGGLQQQLPASRPLVLWAGTGGQSLPYALQRPCLFSAFSPFCARALQRVRVRCRHPCPTERLCPRCGHRQAWRRWRKAGQGWEAYDCSSQRWRKGLGRPNAPGVEPL
jgi:hypothetical protein